MVNKYIIKSIEKVVGGRQELVKILEVITNEEMIKICEVMFGEEDATDKIEEAFLLVLKTKNFKLLMEFIRRVGIGQTKEFDAMSNACYIFFLALYNPNANIAMLREMLRKLNDPIWTVERLDMALNIKEEEQKQRQQRKEEREKESEEESQGL